MRLRKISEADLSERVKWMNNPVVYRTMHFTPPISIEKTIEWHKSNQSNNNRVDVVFEDKDGNLLAMGGLTGIDYSVRKAEFYIFVNPERQRQGIGTKATTLLCKYAFEVLQLHKVYLYTNATNFGAKKTYEKVGFKLEGVHREEMVEKECYEDRLYYGLLASEMPCGVDPLSFSGWNDVVTEKYTIEGRNITIVRDDIYPQTGGGVKSRKSKYYEHEMNLQRFDACVTTGGIQSNHNRAIALMCAQNRWKCHIVFHGTKERYDAENGNAQLVRKSGASVEFVEASQIGSAMDAAIERLTAEGYRPMYIHGGGHDVPGGVALVEAVRSLKQKCKRIGYKPSYIFHASGTGSTQAGIAVGLDLVGWSDVKLIGISIARQKEGGTRVIEEFANILARYYGLDKDYNGKINFNTDYLCGGYENHTPEMNEYLDGVMRQTGIMFDTTYSGKAFYGMMDFMKRNGINDNVLFWHTGGLMNIMT